MNIRKINLNLLVVLDALLSEGNVSRAARKIFITQPAMSNALNQLRDLFKDPLLVRSGRAMIPTPLAVEIAPKIKQILQQIEQTVTGAGAFEPQTAQRTFTIGMSDYVEFVLLPALSEKLEELAPQVNLRIIHLNMLNDPAPFDDGKIDVGIGINLIQSPAINAQSLFVDQAICAARQGHPAMKKLTLKKYLAAKHLAIAYEDQPVHSLTDLTLQKTGASRHIVISVPHILAALHIVARTPWLATVPRRAALALQKPLNLELHKPPLSIPDVVVSLVWHKRFDNDTGHLWLRKLIQDVARC